MVVRETLFTHTTPLRSLQMPTFKTFKKITSSQITGRVLIPELIEYWSDINIQPSFIWVIVIFENDEIGLKKKKDREGKN